MISMAIVGQRMINSVVYRLQNIVDFVLYWDKLQQVCCSLDATCSIKLISNAFKWLAPACWEKVCYKLSTALQQFVDADLLQVVAIVVKSGVCFHVFSRHLNVLQLVNKLAASCFQEAWNQYFTCILILNFFLKQIAYERPRNLQRGLLPHQIWNQMRRQMTMYHRNEPASEVVWKNFQITVIQRVSWNIIYTRSHILATVLSIMRIRSQLCHIG